MESYANNMTSVDDYQKIRETLLEPLFSLSKQEKIQIAADRALLATREREKSLTKPAGALGRLEQLVEHLAFWQAQSPPRLEDVRVIVFAAKHGICSEGVSAYPSVVTEQMVANFQQGGAAINQLCEIARAKLRVEPVSFKSQTENFLHKAAMSSEECAAALKKGMDCVEKADLLALGEMGIGNSSAAAAMLYALYGGQASQWVGTGTGLDDERYRHKIEIVEKSVNRFNQKHGTKKSKEGAITETERAERAWKILCELGGYELAAIVGALIKANALRVPTLLDGVPCCAAAAIAKDMYKSMYKSSLANCLLAHRSDQRGFEQIQKKLGIGSPILDLGMRLGEGSGAALSILILRAALSCHKGMASFEQACVEEKISREIG